MGAEFRQALSARSLAWAVGIPRHQKVYPRDVELVFPVAPRGRPRKRHGPNVLSLSAQDMLTQAKWRMLAWRKGTKGPLKARFAAVRVRVADGQPQRIGDKGMQHMPGEEVWLVGERRASGEQKYYLANLPAETGLKTLAATIKARWVCEQAHQQLKEELGLDHEQRPRDTKGATSYCAQSNPRRRRGSSYREQTSLAVRTACEGASAPSIHDRLRVLRASHRPTGSMMRQKLIGAAGVTYVTTLRKMSKAGASAVAVSLLVASTTMVTPVARL